MPSHPLQFAPDARYAVSFSGGKDSMLALDRARRAGGNIARLVTLYDGASERVRFHAVPTAVMRAQAAALALPTSLYHTTPATFEEVFLRALRDLRAEGIAGVIFGNIHLADVRAWYEDRVRGAGLAHIEPLWGDAPAALAAEVVDRGFHAMITCIDESRADPAWLGQPLTTDLLADFAARGIDLCGEHGEYHTLVTDGPHFAHPLAVRAGMVHVEDRFRQLGVELADA